MIGIVYDSKTGKSETVEVPDDKYVESPVKPPTETELLQSEVITLKARLAKIEAVTLVKTALEPAPVIKDPIIGK